VCSAKTSAGIMRHSFPMNIRDADHTKYLSLESDNQVVTYACASVELAVVWKRPPQAFQDPSSNVGVLYCSVPPKAARSFVSGLRSMGS
jgi:hypothetical protein